MVKLYQLPNCPYCVKVRSKLQELGVDYEVVNIDPLNRPEVVKKLGGTVPVLEDGERVMNESSDIIAYLEKKYSGQ